MLALSTIPNPTQIGLFSSDFFSPSIIYCICLSLFVGYKYDPMPSSKVFGFLSLGRGNGGPGDRRYGGSRPECTGLIFTSQTNNSNGNECDDAIQIIELPRVHHRK